MDERPVLHRRLERLGVASWSLLGAGLLAAGAVWLLSKIRVVILPTAVAMAIIYLLNPVVDRLARRRVPRLLGAVAAYALLFGILSLVGLAAVPAITEQANQFGEILPQILDAAAARATETAARLGMPLAFTPTVEGLLEWWDDPRNRELVLSQLGRLTAITRGLVETLLLVILAPVLAFYLLVDLPDLQRQARDFLPPRLRDEAVHLAGRLSRSVGGFVRGQLVLALIVGVLSAVALRLIGLPFWLLIGMTAGVLNLVPLLGPWVGGILAVLVALSTRDVATAVWAAAIFAAIQQLDNHVIGPNVLRVTVRLHPATIILALLAGGTLAGLLGVLVAVPVAAATKIVIVHLWRTRVLGEDWDRATEDLVVERPPAPRGSLLRRLRDISEVSPGASERRAGRRAGIGGEAQDR